MFDRFRSFLTLGIALALLAAACGGSNKTAGTSSTTSTSTAASTSSASTTTTVDATRLVMGTALLRAGDLPRTWKDSGESSASTSNQAQLKVAKTIPACRDFARAVERENRQSKVSSNKFVDSTAAPTARGEVSNDVVAWPTVAAAKAAYDAYSAGVMKSCLTQVFRRLVAQQVVDSRLKVTISVDNLSVPAVGDGAVAYQAVATLTTGSTSQQIGFIIQIVRVSRYIVSYNATLYGAAPTNFGKNLVVRSIARLEASPL